MGRYESYGDWAPYVPVAEKKRLAVKEATRRLKKGQAIEPVEISGRKITKNFWGNAWCENLNQYSDFANRLPRGRTYACNGSVVDLKIQEGKIVAIVAGSEPYDVKISIKQLDAKIWKRLCKDCAESIHSIIDLMRGKLPDQVLQRITVKQDGMFPSPREISMSCDCPDASRFCKHLAAVMYGIGSRLDTQPELLFKLRGVSQHDLLTESVSKKSVDGVLGLDQQKVGGQDGIDSGDLEAIFGIDLNIDLNGDSTRPTKPPRKKRSPVKRKQAPADPVKAVKPAKKRVKKKVAIESKTAPKKKKSPKKKIAKAKKSKSE